MPRLLGVGSFPETRWEENMNNWRSDYELPGIPATLTTLVLVWPQACCAAADILTTLGLSFPIYSEGLGR